MRVGKNPSKEKKLTDSLYQHQVVIPVYIPYLKDYYKDSLEILKLCLGSLLKTKNDYTFITVVNNGSCNEVVNYLNSLFKEKRVQEVIHIGNIGKNRAIIKGVSSHNFRFVTISDADVLFLNNWQEQTMQVFTEFPKAGVVGLVPQFKMYKTLSYNVLFDNFFSKYLRFRKVRNPEALVAFYRSLGWDDNYNKDYLNTHLTLMSKNGSEAIIGSGHFVATYKRELIGENPSGIINQGLSPKYDRELLDMPTLKKDAWRLTTADNYAYHMGNEIEVWMNEEDNKPLEKSKLKHPYQGHKNHKSKPINNFIKNYIFRKLLQNESFLRRFLISKGLPKNIAKKY
ncbi:MAG: glycosyltransferase family 2 protein [Flavobacteriaceae bacterium]